MQEKKPHPGASDSATRYWDSISATMAECESNAVWRRHSDTVNERLIAQWMHGKRYASLLKTDLFDESIGVGLVPLLSGCSDQVHGVDISEACVNTASDRYPGLSARVADVRHMPYADAHFDCVVSNSTLDHFPTLKDMEFSLTELHRVLNTGGDLLITLDNLQNPIIWLRSVLPYRWLNKIGLLPYYVGATATVRGLRKMLTEAGFEIKASTAIMHCPRVAVVPASNWVQKHCGKRGQQRWLRLLMAFEWLGRTPLRYLTGHFVAVHAVKA